MGQGGHVILVNGTPYVWDLIDSGFKHMEWEFKQHASDVQPFSTRSVYVEREISVWKVEGHATYQLRGTNHKFKIVALEQELSVVFIDLETQNAANNSSLRIGTISDWCAPFILSGTTGNFSSVGAVKDWMQKKLPQIRQRNLTQICLPASHDSGMSGVTWKTTIAGTYAIQTQKLSVEAQLNLGVRHFDIRPHLFEDKFVCGHYSWIDKEPIHSWQGGNGELISKIVEGINRYTESSKELIVLRLHEVRSIKNHDGKFVHEDFQDLTHDEWRRLLREFTAIRDLWLPLPSHGPRENIKLTQIPVEDFIGGHRAAVLIIADPPSEVSIADYKGIFRSSSMEWDASPWEKPEDQRLQTFLDAKRNRPQIPYAYSGCHTQADDEAIWSTFGDYSKSVVELAKFPQEKVYRDLMPACSKDLIPNAITFDAITDSALTALAMAFTDRAMS